MSVQGIVAFALISAGALFAAACAGTRVLETWETTHGTMNMRVRKFPEWPPLNPVPRVYFTLDVATDRHGWHKVLAWEAGGPIPIPREQVGFVGDQVLYAYGNSTYVVTIDSGTTWASWDALEEVKNLHEAAIMAAKISEGGVGTICLQYSHTFDPYHFRFVTYSSTDFGRRWTPTPADSSDRKIACPTQSQ